MYLVYVERVAAEELCPVTVGLLHTWETRNIAMLSVVIIIIKGFALPNSTGTH